MGKRLGTYRVDRELLATVAVKAAERGDTVTDVIVRALQAYIRDEAAAGITSAAPVGQAPVYTPPPEEPAREEPTCRHPAEYVEAGECRSCGADVW